MFPLVLLVVLDEPGVFDSGIYVCSQSPALEWSKTVASLTSSRIWGCVSTAIYRLESMRLEIWTGLLVSLLKISKDRWLVLQVNWWHALIAVWEQILWIMLMILVNTEHLGLIEWCPVSLERLLRLLTAAAIASEQLVSLPLRKVIVHVSHSVPIDTRVLESTSCSVWPLNCF